MNEREIVLGSRSPRRAEILATLGVPFIVRPGAVDESLHCADDDQTFVRTLAERKLDDVLRRSDIDDRYVLCADTVVCVDEARLGQPRDDDEALEMLRRLAGRDHVVRTGVAVGHKDCGQLDCIDVATRVWFRDVDEDSLRRYVASGESRDKAGAYAVQGLGSGLVARLEGSYTNVVGLPAAEVIELLVRHGALRQWPAARPNSAVHHASTSGGERL